MRNISVWKADDEVYLKFRLLCLGRRLSSAELLKKLVTEAYEADQTMPGKKEKRLMKRLVKRWRP